MRGLVCQPLKARARARARVSACLAAVVVSALAIPAALTVPTAVGATQRPAFCGHIQGTVAVGARQVTCSRARRVANDYLDGHKNPLGFRCRRYKVDAAAGWYAKCTRHATYVQITPE